MRTDRYEEEEEKYERFIEESEKRKEAAREEANRRKEEEQRKGKADTIFLVITLVLAICVGISEDIRNLIWGAVCTIYRPLMIIGGIGWAIMLGCIYWSDIKAIIKGEPIPFGGHWYHF